MYYKTMLIPQFIFVGTRF